MRKIIIIFLGLFTLLGCASGEVKPENEGSKPQEQEKGKEKPKEPEKPKDKIYGLDEVVTYSEDDVDLYTFKVNSVKLTEERNEFSEKEVEQVVVINYTYENINDPDGVYVSSINFTVIDEDGNVSETYPAGSEVYPQDAPIGAKSHGEESYGLIHESSSIKFHFNPSIFGDTKAIFELPIE